MYTVAYIAKHTHTHTHTHTYIYMYHVYTYLTLSDCHIVDHAAIITGNYTYTANL